MTKSSWAALVAVALASSFGVSSAHAHGRLPELNAILFDANDRDHIVARATWGMIVSNDGGATWNWRCSDPVPFNRFTEDPAMVLNDDGNVVVASYRNNVRMSSNDACDWQQSPMAPPSGYMVDITAYPGDPSRLFMLRSPGSPNPEEVVTSTDGGTSWASLSALPAEVDAQLEPRGFLSEKVAFAPSDPSIAYVSGVFYDPPAGAVYRSADGGLTWATRVDVPLLEGETGFQLLGIDPTDPERIFVRTVRNVASLEPERLLLIEDGVARSEPVLQTLEIVGLAISADGSHVWAGSWDGGFYRSDDGGSTFQMLSEQRIRCLDWRAGADGAPDELWVCVDNLLGGTYSLGISTDSGATIEPIWRFNDFQEDTGCGFASAVGMMCPAIWPDLSFDTGVRDADGGVPGGDGGVSGSDAGAADGSVSLPDGSAGNDAGVGGSDAGIVDDGGGSSSGCSCRVPTKSVNGWSLVLGSLGLIWAIRRRRRV